MSTDGPWASAMIQATAALYTALESAVEQTVYGAVYAATGSQPTAAAIAPPAAQQFASAFAPAYTQQSLAAFRTQLTQTGIAAGSVSVAIFMLVIGTVLWSWALYDRKRARAYLMLCGAVFGILTGCMSLFLNLRPDKVNLQYIIATAVFGAINIVSMLCSNIYSVTLFWTNAKHRREYQAVSALVLTTLAIISVVFISIDIQPCGYTYCTARSRYIIPIIPLIYVGSYLLMWTYSVWKFVNGRADGGNKTVKQLAKWSTVCGILCCLCYLGESITTIVIATDQLVLQSLYILYAVIPIIEFVSDHGARLQGALDQLMKSESRNKPSPKTVRSDKSATRASASGRSEIVKSVIRTDVNV